MTENKTAMLLQELTNDPLLTSGK